jgi:phosphoribosylamine---glycine ligase
MREAGRPFTGLLYAGLMLTPAGPRVVEFNCRFGDPETQAVMALLDRGGVFIGYLMAWIARGGRLPSAAGALQLTLSSVLAPGGVAPAAVTTVVAADGYPEKPRAGDPITLPESLPEGVHVFHAGTALDADGRLVTAGGRVLAVTAVADRFDEARARSRGVAEQVEFAGRRLRSDIGWREGARRSVS